MFAHLQVHVWKHANNYLQLSISFFCIFLKNLISICVILFATFLPTYFIASKYICTTEYVHVFGIWNLPRLVTNIKGPIESKCDVSELTSRFVRLLGEQSVEHCEEFAKQTTAWQWMYTTFDWLDVNWKVFKLKRASLAGDGRKCTKLTLEHLNGRRKQSSSLLSLARFLNHFEEAPLLKSKIIMFTNQTTFPNGIKKSKCFNSMSLASYGNIFFVEFY